MSIARQSLSERKAKEMRKLLRGTGRSKEEALKESRRLRKAPLTERAMRRMFNRGQRLVRAWAV